MTTYKNKNNSSNQRSPIFPVTRFIFAIHVFFLLFVAIGIVIPVTALDEANQTLVDDLISKGDECYNNKDYSCTWAAYDSAHLIDSSNYEILSDFGWYLSETGDNTRALEKMDAALAINSFDPDNAWIWQEKGKILDKLGRFTESGYCYDRAEQLDPTYRVPATKRYPLNILIKNATIIVLVAGFFVLGIYIYLNERHRW